MGYDVFESRRGFIEIVVGIIESEDNKVIMGALSTASIFSRDEISDFFIRKSFSKTF
jgi:hypothetical protein